MASTEVDSEEEETIVVVELHGILENDWMHRIGDKCKIVGLEADEPVLQLDRYVFRGEYKDTVGSMVLFEQQQEQPDDEEEGKDENMTNKTFTYSCHTHKKLHMQRAFLTERMDDRTHPSSTSNGAASSESNDQVPSATSETAGENVPSMSVTISQTVPTSDDPGGS